MPLQLDEEALVRETIEQIALPKGVRLQRVEQSNAWTGEPALRIYFAVSKSIPLTTARVKALGRVREELVDKLLASGLEKWPFIRWLDAK